MVGHSKWLLFRQVVPSRSITLLIFEMASRASSYSTNMSFKSLSSFCKGGWDIIKLDSDAQIREITQVAYASAY